MAHPFSQLEAGSTYQCTWVASSDPSTLRLAILTASATAVASLTAISSGIGAWYAFVTIPDSFGSYPAYLMQEWTATVSTQAGTASPFITRQVVEVVKTQPFIQGRTQ